MGKKVFQIISIFCVAAVVFSCSRLKFEDDADIIAKVGDNKLRRSEVEQMIKSPMSLQDSLIFISDYAEKWIKRELKKKNAEEKFTDKTIEKMVEDYRLSLLTYKYEQQYTSKVSDEVSDKEIEEYYGNNKENFVLVGPMVKARILRLLVNYKNLKSVTQKFYSAKPDDVTDVDVIAAKDELLLYDFSKRWYYFDEIVDYIPLTYSGDMDKFIRENKKYEVRGPQYIYLMVIFDHKQTGGVIPLEFMKEPIKKAIINNRKILYLNSVEDSLYDDAINSKEAFNKYHNIDFRKINLQDSLIR